MNLPIPDATDSDDAQDRARISTALTFLRSPCDGGALDWDEQETGLVDGRGNRFAVVVACRS
ncbi:MAG: hypothetical protein EB084_24120 [Proteobacteria bacterium]|nr:hypothetical protein [Pseudomonadota bacterium]